MTKNYSNPFSLRKGLKQLCIAALSLVGGAAAVNAQVSGYIFSQSNGTYSSIATTGTLVPLSEATLTTTNDTSGWSVNIPFTFKFNNVDYTSVFVNSNGGVTFGSVTNSGSSLISSTTAYDGAIGVMNRDLWGMFITGGVTSSGSNVITGVSSFHGLEVGKELNNVNGIPAGATVTAFDPVAGTITMSAPATSSSTAAVLRWATGKVFTSVQGTAPNRTFVIEWVGYNDYGTAVSASNYLNFQLKLAETTNSVSNVYGPLAIYSTTSKTNQIGLRGATNTDFNNRLATVTTPWTATTPGTANSSTVARDNSNYPASGLTFTWTPASCFSPTDAIFGAPTTTTLPVSWTAITPAPLGYDLYYSTTNTAPTPSTVLDPTNSVSVTTNSATISGLTPATNYYVWIRTKCSATDYSNWIPLPMVATNCGPVTSMFENFDSYATGNIVPTCWVRLAPATTPGSQTITSTTPASGTRNIYQYATTSQNPVIVVLPEFSNVNAGTHQLRFKARVTTAPGTLEIGYVTNVTDPTSFVLLQSLNITNTTYTAAGAEYIVLVPASVPATARLAIRNAADGKSYYWDDVYWEAAPTCIAPTAITLGTVDQTTATVSWTASATGTPTGYTVYYSTTNTAPTSSTVLNATNSVTVTGTTATITNLTPSTNYYVWVRANCSATDMSDWTEALFTITTACQPPAVTTVTGQTVCANNSATLTATADPGATINWYSASTGGTPLATGNSFTTPALTSTTTYYVSAGTGSTANVGKTTIESGASASGGSLSSYMVFTAHSDFTLLTVDLFPYSSVDGTAGTVTIELQTDSGTPITSTTVNVVGHNSVSNSVPQTVTLNFPVTGGQTYRLKASAWTGVTNMYRDITNLSFPYTIPNVVSITESSLGTGYYYFFYNWSVSTLCESARTAVTATVNSDPNCSMSTTETAADAAITLYPNPFAETLNIDKIEKVKSVTIVDASGRTVKRIAKPQSVINTSDLSSGMYLVKLEMKDGSTKTVKAIRK